MVPSSSEPPKSLSQAVDLSEVELLMAMRTRTASEIDGGVPAHALAPLLRQLREFDKEIRSLKEREAQEATKRADATDQKFDASSI